jgi:hypothetical protein
MSHRNQLHQFDAAVAEIRTKIQAATHGITTVAGEAGGLFITCFPLAPQERVAPAEASGTVDKLPAVEPEQPPPVKRKAANKEE